MDGEGQQIEAHEHGREVLLAVTEVVLKVVALVLQDVERLVLDLPSGPAAGGEFGDVVAADRQIGDEAVAICRLCRLASMISISNQLTVSASLPSRSGTSRSQR